jgi:glycine/D-amino acid oxidase-like deaminating enzyme
MKPKHHSIVILGRGLASLGVAWSLAKRGVKDILIVGPARTHARTASNICVGATPALSDNITRIMHRHGEDVARRILHLCDAGYSELLAAAKSVNQTIIAGHARRLATSDHELQEMKIATSHLKTFGIRASLEEQEGTRLLFHAVQNEGLPSAVFDMNNFLSLLEAELNLEILETTATRINHTGTLGCRVFLASNETIDCDICIAGVHQGLPELIPSLSPALWYYSDQSVSLSAKNSAIADTYLKTGDVAMINHGNYKVWRTSDHSIAISGGRFLRNEPPDSNRWPEVSPQVTKHLMQKAQEWFDRDDFLEDHSSASLECLPCDELPVIGPMFGQEEVYISTGFAGLGAAMAFGAGLAITELIQTGRTKLLHPLFEPKRHRSLSD